MKRPLTLILAIAGLALTAMAEKEHVVERGETIESIARIYDVTPASLIEANPSAGEFFYTGMVLTIPEGTIQESNRTNDSNSTAPDNQYPVSDTTSSTSDTVALSKEAPESTTNTIDSFSNWYVGYQASFNDFSHGFYGLGWQFFGKEGWGMEFSMWGDWGLGNGDMMWMFGPIYGYDINQYFAISAPLRGYVVLYDAYDEKKGKETTKTTGGILVTPTAIGRLGRLQFSFGYSFGWMHGVNKLVHNAEFHIGYNF